MLSNDSISPAAMYRLNNSQISSGVFAGTIAPPGKFDVSRRTPSAGERIFKYHSLDGDSLASVGPGRTRSAGTEWSKKNGSALKKS